jgi:hypothetical protein
MSTSPPPKCPVRWRAPADRAPHAGESARIRSGADAPVHPRCIVFRAHGATRAPRSVASAGYSIAFAMSSTTFFASPNTIIVLSM